MSPVERGNGWEMHLGDCLDVMPTLARVDAIITDPPFGIGFKYETHDDDPAAYEDFMVRVVERTERLRRGDGPAAFWQGMPRASDWHLWFPRGWRIIASCKTFVQIRPGLTHAWDPVVWWGKTRRKRGESGAWRDWHVANNSNMAGSDVKRTDHPCQRPVAAVEYVVQALTRTCDSVLDAFAGSGTTGIACLRLGRRFVGIEKDPKYFALACDRLRAEEQGSTLRAARAGQIPLLGGVK